MDTAATEESQTESMIELKSIKEAAGDDSVLATYDEYFGDSTDAAMNPLKKPRVSGETAELKDSEFSSAEDESNLQRFLNDFH